MSGDAQAAAFEAIRPRLFGIAYRMTGSVADAEDLCQETWLRWSTADHAAVDEPEAFLVTVTTRLAIDRLRSAQRRREAYVGPWLPEPLVAPPTTTDDPEARAELADSLTFGFLTLLDELSPTERAVLLLHDVFGHDFAATAEVVGTTPAAARKAASRARAKVRRDEDQVVTAEVAGRDDLVRRRLADLGTALVMGDTDGLLALLAPEVVQLDDGGAEVRAARRPVVGRDRVARFLVNVTRRLMELEPTIEEVDANGAPAVLIRVDGQPAALMAIAVDPDDRIERIWVQLNPQKLAHLS